MAVNEGFVNPKTEKDPQERYFTIPAGDIVFL